MSPRAVAEFMVQEMGSEFYRYLHQRDVVHQIQQQYGDEFVYTNSRGNLAIKRAVLKEFELLTKGKVVWVRKDQCWRRREAYDGPGRQV